MYAHFYHDLIPYRHGTSKNTMIMCDPWSTKPVLSLWGILLAIANNTLYGSKLYFMPKIFRILSKHHVP